MPAPNWRNIDKALETFCRHLECPRPEKRNIESVARWLEGNKPLAIPESSFLNDWNDLIGPSDQLDHGGLDAAVASIGAALHRWGLPSVKILNEGD